MSKKPVTDELVWDAILAAARRQDAPGCCDVICDAAHTDLEAAGYDASSVSRKRFIWAWHTLMGMWITEELNACLNKISSEIENGENQC